MEAEALEEMSLSDAVAAIRQDPALMRCITAWERIAPRPARFGPWPSALDPRLVAALRERGVDRLYTHQSQAIETVLAGKHVVLATSTASGKTLAYNLPALSHLLNDAAACALYLFPTKALAHDQIAALGALISDPLLSRASIAVAAYDGDTPSHRRPAVRREARLLVTNPDMVHTGILPHHTRWARFFSGLRYVVLDELHGYRGIFGGHVANLLRRLRRICRFYGSFPQFICASATIANPRQLAEQLVEADVTLIDDDGSPRGEKHLVLLNPPLVNPQLGIRRSAILVANDIAARFLDAGVQTIVFARARLATEVLLGYLRDSVAAAGGAAEAVRGYRGGYLPGERREIELGLREGSIRGVVATNALELGVDIGQLDACVMAGYPGTIASTWQQAGRAGRRAGLSVAVMVASALPIDQYLVTHPRYFLAQSVERALLDPDNLAVLANHMACAAFELPFEAGERFGDMDSAAAVLDALVEEGALHRRNGRFTWIGEGYPAGGLSLRTSTPDNIVIQAVSGSQTRVIGQMDRPSAPILVHEGAVYLHEGVTFVIRSLDWKGGIARAEAADLDYYTRASSTTDVQVVRELDDVGTETVRYAWGDLLVTTRATGYRTIKRYTHETLAWAPIDLPEQQLHTAGFWLEVSDELTMQLREDGILPPPADYGPDWAVQRDAARARDGYACRHCGASARDGHQLDVHHVTPFRTFGYVPGVNDRHRLANQLDNLVTLCSSCHRYAERGRAARGALSGLGYALRSLAPLYVMCAPGDLGSSVQSQARGTGLPTVTLYDRAPGGAGLSPALFEIRSDLLVAALEVVRRCPCDDGCPGCVGPVGDVERRTKALTARLIEAILGGQQPDREPAPGRA